MNLKVATRSVFLVWGSFAMILLLFSQTALAQDQTCKPPPFVVSGMEVKPNALILMGTNVSMGQAAYPVTKPFDPTQTYYGYFNTDYPYNATY